MRAYFSRPKEPLLIDVYLSDGGLPPAMREYLSIFTPKRMVVTAVAADERERTTLAVPAVHVVRPATGETVHEDVNAIALGGRASRV